MNGGSTVATSPPQPGPERAEHRANEAERLLHGRPGLISNYVKAAAHAVEASRRWMYGRSRQNRVAAILNRATVAAISAGLAPRRLVALEVHGRRTGRLIVFPVVVADLGADRYVVAMLGNDTRWIANVRTAGGRVVLRHGRGREAVRLSEVGPGARAPILRRYLEVAPGARAHIPVDRDAPLIEFEQIAAQYPVFRVEADSSQSD